MFGANAGKSDVLDWTITEKERSVLALELLELIRICVKDLSSPDFKQDKYTQIEI